ncbi:MAG: T9SS type A sorting domain-containing protein, partial [Lentimicrobium sp.]|nr:T9SS type A sorting domain-containing protein [Lentimicrobium sp.]
KQKNSIVGTFDNYRFGTSDAVLLLDDYTEGVFNVDFYIYIPTGKVGYFNLLQDFAGSTSQWGMQAYFNIGGGGTVDAGALSAAAFTYTYDTWHHVSVKIDLDNDFAVMKLNDTELVSWVWSSGSFGTGTLNKFDAANFYAWAETGTPGAFFDDISITMEPETTAKALTFEPGEPLGANVYRDGMLIAELVTDTLYLDEAVAPGVYNYCVTYIYEGGAESCLDATCLEVSVLEDCVAPTDLTAVLAADPAKVILTWNTFAGVWMHYGDLVYADAIGLTDFSPFTVAIQWDPADLADYDGRAFNKIRLYYGTGSIGDISVQVWEGTTLVLEEAVTSTIVGESWNEIEFNEPVVIDATKSYRLGYTTSNYDGFPAGAQNYANDPNSDLVLLDGVWDNLSNYLPYSWMIETFIGQAPAGAFNAPVESAIVSKATSANLVSSPVAVNTSRSDVGRSADRAFLGYNVYREGAQVNSELVPENTYLDIPGTPGNYCYTVTAVYSVCGESEPSNEACVDVLVGLNDQDLANNRIYPNPSNSIVNIELTSNISQVVVYNYVGQVVFEQNVTKSETIQLNVRNYEAGAYLVKFLTNSGESFTKKVVVTH